MESLFTLVFPYASGSDSQDTVWITILVLIILGACAALWSFLRKKDAGHYSPNQEDSYHPAEYSYRRKWTWQLHEPFEKHESNNTTSAFSGDQPSEIKPALPGKQTTPQPAMAKKEPEQKPVIAEVISPLDSGIVKVKPAGRPEPVEKVEAQKTPIEIRETKSKKKSNLSGGLELLESDFFIELVCRIGPDSNDDTKMKRIAFEELKHRELLSRLPGTVLKEYSVNKNRRFSKSIQCAALAELASRTRQKQTVKS